jgi:hypothetical protein
MYGRRKVIWQKYVPILAVGGGCNVWIPLDHDLLVNRGLKTYALTSGRSASYVSPSDHNVPKDAVVIVVIIGLRIGW